MHWAESLTNEFFYVLLAFMARLLQVIALSIASAQLVFGAVPPPPGQNLEAAIDGAVARINRAVAHGELLSLAGSLVGRMRRAGFSERDVGALLENAALADRDAFGGMRFYREGTDVVVTSPEGAIRIGFALAQGAGGNALEATVPDGTGGGPTLAQGDWVWRVAVISVVVMMLSGASLIVYLGWRDYKAMSARRPNPLRRGIVGDVANLNDREFAHLEDAVKRDRARRGRKPPPSGGIDCRRTANSSLLGYRRDAHPAPVAPVVADGGGCASGGC